MMYDVCGSSVSVVCHHRIRSWSSSTPPSVLCSLVAGSVRGQLDELYARVDAVCSKAGAFDLVICVGDFVGDGVQLEQYMGGLKKASIRTLVVTGDQRMTAAQLLGQFGSGGVLCQDIVFCGAYGVTVVSGLSIAFLGGVYSSSFFSKSRRFSTHAPTDRSGKVCHVHVDGDVDVDVDVEWLAFWILLQTTSHCRVIRLLR